MALQPFTGPRGQVSPGPAAHAFAITPGTAALPYLTRAIYVGGAGNVEVQLAGDTAPVTLTGVPVGTTLEVCAQYVLATNTTATNLIGMW